MTLFSIPLRLRSTAGSRAIAWVGGLAALIVADGLFRQVLPAGISLLLPAIELAACTALAGRLMRKQAANLAPDHGASITLVPDEPGDAALAEPAGSMIADVGADQRDAAIARAIAELEQYPTFMYILHEQMNSVTQLSEDAAASILSNLGNVDLKITTLLDSIRQSDSNEGVAHLTAQIESQMNDCRDMLQSLDDQQKREVKAGSQQRARIGVETDNVLGVVNRVNGIARQTMMLSFNVSIEAAQTGEASRGFSVIALEIRKLASEVQSLSRDMHARVKKLMQTVTVDLEEHEKQRELAEHDAIANVIVMLSQLSGSLVKLIAHQRGILQRVERDSAAIADPIMDMMGSVQFQDVIRQQLQQLKLTSDAVGSQIKAICMLLESPQHEMAPETLSDRLDAMFASYVMAHQRNTHVAALGKTVERNQVAAIELF